MNCDVGEATEGLGISCDVGEVTERLENRLFTNVTAHKKGHKKLKCIDL